MADLLVIVLFGLFVFVPGMAVFGVILNVLTSQNISKRIDEKLKDCGFELDYSEEDWTR